MTAVYTAKLSLTVNDFTDSSSYAVGRVLADFASGPAVSSRRAFDDLDGIFTSLMPGREASKALIQDIDNLVCENIREGRPPSSVDRVFYLLKLRILSAVEAYIPERERIGMLEDRGIPVYGEGNILDGMHVLYKMGASKSVTHSVLQLIEASQSNNNPVPDPAVIKNVRRLYL